MQSLSQWTTREVPRVNYNLFSEKVEVEKDLRDLHKWSQKENRSLLTPNPTLLLYYMTQPIEL